MRPGLDRPQQIPTDSRSSVFGAYKDALKECDGRSLTSVNVFVAQGGFGKCTNVGFIDNIQKGDEFSRWPGEYRRYLIEVLVAYYVIPQLGAELSPTFNVQGISDPYWHSLILLGVR